MILKTIREYIHKQENSKETVSKYINNIYKECKLMCKTRDINEIVVGHLHKDIHHMVNEVHIHVVDAYEKGYNVFKEFITNKGKLILVVSDVHLKNNTNSSVYTNLLELMQNDKYDKVILLGDILDLWVTNPNKLVSSKDVNKFINVINLNKNIIYIKGNHDYDINSYIRIKCNEDVTIDNYYFIHGHQFDPIFNANFVSKIYWTLQLYIGDNFYKFNRFLNKTFRGE